MGLPGDDLYLRMKEEAARQAGMAASNTAASVPSPLSGNDILARGKDESARTAADLAQSSADYGKRVLISVGIGAAVLACVVLYLQRK